MLRQALMEFVVKQRLKKLRVSEDFKVETYLGKIVEWFDPVKAKDRWLTIIYEFHDSGANDGVWAVSIADGKCSLTKGEPEHFDTRLYMTADTYRRLLTGRLEFGRLAYSTGAIRYFGNTLGHRELNEYITLPKNAGVAAL